MEDVDLFLKISDGIGYDDGDDSGCGSGYGNGSCSGDGSGNGSGSGYDDGDGYGDGIGSGYGYDISIGDVSGYGKGCGIGIIAINEMPIYMVDVVPTIIANVKGNVAKGWIVKSDLTLDLCYIAKKDNMFAHGKTIREAMKALDEKIFENLPEEERIEAFLEAVEDGPKYPAKLFFDWHGMLTGSCQMGREVFIKNHGINLEHDKMTLRKFIKLTRDDYGGEVIKGIERRLEEQER